MEHKIDPHPVQVLLGIYYHCLWSTNRTVWNTYNFLPPQATAVLENQRNSSAVIALVITRFGNLEKSCKILLTLPIIIAKILARNVKNARIFLARQPRRQALGNVFEDV